MGAVRKKGSSGGASNVFNKTTWCGTNRTHFWRSWLMASNVDGGDRVDCQGLVCKQGQSWGASNVCVGHFLAARCLFLCRDAFAGVCTRIGCILCWITGVQLQRDKQYLRWIFFLSDGNNPYKGVRAVLMDYPQKWFTMVGCGGRRESLELE